MSRDSRGPKRSRHHGHRRRFRKTVKVSGQPRRQFERSVTQLRELQQDRQAQKKKDIEDLLHILEQQERKGEPYNPSDDGFVFTAAQIHTARQQKVRSNAWASA